MRKFLLSFAVLFAGVLSNAQEAFQPGWQLGIMFGPSYTAGDAAFNQLVSFPTLSGAALYQFSPVFTLRGELSGYKAKGVVEGNAFKFNYLQLDADAMFDILNIFKYKPERFASPYIFAGLGLNTRFNNGAVGLVEHFKDCSYVWPGSVLGFTLKFGIGTTMRINDKISVDVEIADNLHSNKFNSINDRWDLDQHVNLLVGVRIALGKSKGRSLPAAETASDNVCYVPIPEAPLKAEESGKEVTAPSCEDAVEHNYLILFRIGTSILNEKAKTIIREMADLLKSDQNTRITVSGYSDGVTGFPSLNWKLSEHRAKRVRDALVREGIDIDRITIEFFGDTKEISDNPVENRSVFCVIK